MNKYLPLIGIALIAIGIYLFFAGNDEAVNNKDELTATSTEEVASTTDGLDETDLVPEDTGASAAAGTQLAGTPVATSTADGQVLIGGDAVATPEDDGTAAFTVIGDNFSYDIKEMRVKEGDEVTITFRSNEGRHDWAIDEFDARTEVVGPDGGDTTVTFTADRVGNFEYYCSVGSHRQLGMVGRLIVE